MKKRNIQRILSCLLTLVMLFGMVPAALAADETQPTNYVQNGGFETWSTDGAPLYLSPWQVAEGSTDGVFVFHTYNSGSVGLGIWKEATYGDDGTTEVVASYTANVYQTITNLPAGTYTLSAFSLNYNYWQASDAYIYYYIGDDDSTKETVNIMLNSSSWEELKAENIEVAEGTQ